MLEHLTFAVRIAHKQTNHGKFREPVRVRVGIHDTEDHVLAERSITDVHDIICDFNTVMEQNTVFVEFVDPADNDVQIYDLRFYGQTVGCSGFNCRYINNGIHPHHTYMTGGRWEYDFKSPLNRFQNILI